MINKFIYDSENLKITIVIIHERRIQLSSKGEGTQDGQSATLYYTGSKESEDILQVLSPHKYLMQVLHE